MHSGEVEGRVSSLAGDSTIYKLQGSRTKEADRSSPHSPQPQRLPGPLPRDFDFSHPLQPPRPGGLAGAGVGAVSAGAALPKVRLLTSERPLLSMNGSGSLGTGWQRGYRRHRLLLDAGGCPSRSSGLKENSPSSRQPGSAVPDKHTHPQPGARGHMGGHTRALAHTHTQTRTHPRTRVPCRCAVQSCGRKEGELRWTGLACRLGRARRGFPGDPPEGQEGKRKDPLRLELSAPFSEMTSAKCGLPQAFGTCLRSGAGASVVGEVVNLGHPGSRVTCSAQFSMEPRTHPAPGSPASRPRPPSLLLLALLNV